MNETLRNTIIVASIGVLGYIVYMKYKKQNIIPTPEPAPAPTPTPTPEPWVKPWAPGEAKVWLIEQSKELGIDYGSATDPNKFKYVQDALNIAI